MGRIRATVDTSGKSGHLRKYITIYTNDRVMPVHTVSVSLYVVQQTQ